MQLLNGPQAVANAARVCGISCIIGHEAVSKTAQSLKDEGYSPEILDVHGESATSAAAARTLAGQRCLIENAQELKSLALARLPVVCTTAEPKNWSLVLAPLNIQEILDDTILAYALAEKSLLPAAVIIDKLSTETFESVELPPEKMIKNFLGQLKLDKFHAKFARYDLEGRAQAQKAMDIAQAEIPKLSQEWKKRFRRTLEPFEAFMLEDAELAIVTFGSWSSNAKLAVQELRKQGEKVGLLRLHVLRPWPEQEIHALLQNVSRIAVVDSQISLGSWSKMYQGIKTWYAGFASNFIAKNLLTVQDFIDIARRLHAASAPERVWMI
jgi:pyruvate/2-oxoacid:ferredoxin oxidoreductase alpha subunit